MLSHLAYSLPSVCGFTHHFDISPCLQYQAQAFPDNGVVIG
jgi:hypothetical protein